MVKIGKNTESKYYNINMNKNIGNIRQTVSLSINNTFIPVPQSSIILLTYSLIAIITFMIKKYYISLITQRTFMQCKN